MKTSYVVTLAYILIACSALRSVRSISTYHSSSKNEVDTVQLLDTLVLDYLSKSLVTDSFSVKTESNELIFKQTIFNSTSDTLELQAKASAGWVAPKFSRFILPQNFSTIDYNYLVVNHKGAVNTTITLEYKIKSDKKLKSNYVTIILRGWIE